MVRFTQRLDDAPAQLWRTSISVAPKCAIEGGFHYIHQRAGTEKRPVLTTEEEDVGRIAGVPIQADVGQTQLRLIVANRGNVAVVDFAEVAFEVALNLAGDRYVLRNVRPFKVDAKARGARLDVDLGILGWARAQNIPGIQPYGWKREVIAVGVAAIVHNRSLDEAVRRKRDGTRLNAGQAASLRRVDREHPDRNHRVYHRRRRLRQFAGYP